MRKHKFDGSRSGTGETCFALVDGEKCIQQEDHPVHGDLVDTCAAAAYPWRSEVAEEQADWEED